MAGNSGPPHTRLDILRRRQNRPHVWPSGAAPGDTYAAIVDLGQIQLGELASQIGEQQAFVRAALVRDGDGWKLWTCEAVVEVEPPGWRPASWTYPSHAFVAVVAPASSLLQSLKTDREGEVVVGSFRATVSPIYDMVQWRHLPSRAVYDPSPLPWPSVDYELNGPQPAATSGPSGFMIGEGSPSFTDSDAALRAFFYGDYSTIGAGRTTGRILLIRRIEQAAWIKHVTIGPTHLDVGLRGAPGCSRRHVYAYQWIVPGHRAGQGSDCSRR